MRTSRLSFSCPPADSSCCSCGECFGLVGDHQSALGDRGLADAACDRRADVRVGHVDARRVPGGLGGSEIGLSLVIARLQIVIILHADHVGLDELGAAIGTVLRALQARLRSHVRRLGAAFGGAIHRIVQQVQNLARLDQASFGEQLFLNDAAHLRAHFGHQARTDQAGQFPLQVDRAGFERHDRDRLRGHAALGSRPFAAAGKCEDNSGGQSRLEGGVERAGAHDRQPWERGWALRPDRL